MTTLYVATLLTNSFLIIDLLNENIVDDSACAQKVEKEAGFRAWRGWERNCKGRSYPTQIVNACLPKSGLSVRKRLVTIFDLE